MATSLNIINFVYYYFFGSSPSRALAARATTAVAPAVDINNLASLVDTLAQATSMIQAAGLAVPALTPARAALAATGTLIIFIQSMLRLCLASGSSVHNLIYLAFLSIGGLSPTIRPTNDPNYCSAKLPAAQPLAHIESEVKERFVPYLISPFYYKRFVQNFP